MKKVLVILGHPDGKSSFNAALAESYVKGAKAAGAEVRLTKLGDLKFDPILHHGYAKIQKLEPDLKQLQEDIKWADHLVWVFPTWWGSMPAILKGALDRMWLPGFAFKFKRAYWPTRLLKGKSARLIVTMDSPWPIYHLVFGGPGENIMKRSVLHFSGIRPVRVTHVHLLKIADRKKLQFWIKKIRLLGRQLK